ncbi:ATP-binding protein [Acrocarpospora catenulata]|uniref:ATP-binding protein n=1 Tax=Acrocarpospora catenulata TaxID=2836182 RepID=UPI001BDA17B5|nr:ATP-binding protein [Acrocarpospora catenulata]
MATTTGSVLGTLDLVGKPESVHEARHFVRRLLGDGFPRLDDIALLTSELVTNSIRHSRSGNGGQITVAVAEGPGFIHVDVIDEGSEEDKWPCVSPDPFGEGGRGLVLVAAMARAWSYADDEAGRVVWFVMDLTANAEGRAG